MRRRHGGEPDRPLAALADSSRCQPGCVRAACVSAGVERVHGGGGESVRFVLVEVQVDVGKREPGAVALTVG